MTKVAQSPRSASQTTYAFPDLPGTRSGSRARVFRALLQVDKVSLEYRTEQRTVRATHDVSFDVFRGDRFVLLGPSGCGKSSLLKAVAGFIAPRAGRFFICPKSHKIGLDTHAVHNSIAENHERYILSVVQHIRKTGLTIRAPKLDKGDVLFWNAWTIHGSLDTQDATKSRSSMTCHAIPRGKRLLQLQSRTVEVVPVQVKDAYIYRPKDLQLARNRLIFFVESHLPRLFYWLKRRAIVYVLKHKSV